jgi:hypothetical protein
MMIDCAKESIRKSSPKILKKRLPWWIPEIALYRKKTRRKDTSQQSYERNTDIYEASTTQSKILREKSAYRDMKKQCGRNKGRHTIKEELGKTKCYLWEKRLKNDKNTDENLTTALSS